MKEFIISKAQEGQKAIKYCGKVLPQAQSSFLHKMMRKKNITRNGKKLDGNDILHAGDCIRFFFSDETFDKFAKDTGVKEKKARVQFADRGLEKDRILYEDDDVLFYNKPAGMLSQKAVGTDISLNEYFLQYLLSSGQLDAGQLATLKPSVCNRLDRNTSGIVLCGKSYLGLTALNAMLKERTLSKFYRCIVVGRVNDSIHVSGYLKKDETKNTVQISDREFPGSSYIETEIVPLQTNREFSLLEIHLITGKTHQIRAHLAHLGHPIVGDYKYGVRAVNDRLKRSYGLSHQLLHAYRIEFPDQVQAPLQLAGRTFTAPAPELFHLLTEKMTSGDCLT